MKTYPNDEVMMRTVFVDEMTARAKTDERIVALDADLASSSGFSAFAKTFPDRFFNCGVAEANMIGVAAGLSATGKIPFVHSFGTFASRRVCDQIFISGAYSGAKLIIVGSDPGVTAAYNGGTHMPFEDMAVLRAIPGVTLIEITDGVMLRGVFDQLIDIPSVCYVRLKRKNPAVVYEPGTAFNIGKANVLRDGNDITIISSGITVSESLIAAETLEESGISARVINMHTWKPLDKEAVATAAKETNRIITIENHNIVGGLGSAVCEAVCETFPCPVVRLGINDSFGEVGTEDYLKERFKLTAVNIVKAAQTLLNK